MVLSADQPRSYARRGDELGLPVQASTTVYAGGALSVDTGGEVGPLNTSDAGFAGFAINGVDNSSGSASDKKVRVLAEGLIELAVVDVGDNDDHGDIVYATDDNTFTLNASGSMKIGRVVQIDNTGDTNAVVRFQALSYEHNND